MYISEEKIKYSKNLDIKSKYGSLDVPTAALMKIQVF
jgi:hypothetical protein